MDDRNGEISVNPNYQCRLCNCSFKVKFVNICQTSYISTENLFSPSKRKEFNSGVFKLKTSRKLNSGLEITAGQRTMSGLTVDLTGQTFVVPVMLTRQNSIVLKMK